MISILHPISKDNQCEIMVLKTGTEFVHKSWLDSKYNPLLCRVTKISKGVVYWRPVDGGSPMKFSVEQTNRFVKEIVK